MKEEIEDKNILSPILNFTFEDCERFEINVKVTVPRTYESIPSLLKTFKSELDSWVEKVTAYIQNEAIKCEETKKESCTNDVPIPCLIPIKKKVRIRDRKKDTNESCCPHCGKIYPNYKLQEHINNVHNVLRLTFMCDKCNYQGTSKAQFKEHMKRHREGKVPCQICGKLTLKVDLRRHMYRIHNAERQKMVPCTVCGKEFKKQQLLKHMRNVHAPRTAACDLCDYKARDTYNLKLHISKMHLGVKDLPKEKCQYCDEETTNLKYHIQLYHRDWQ